MDNNAGSGAFHGCLPVTRVATLQRSFRQPGVQAACRTSREAYGSIRRAIREEGARPTVIEPAVYAARVMAQGCERLPFVALGAAGHLAAVASGARTGREEIRRLEAR